MSEYAARMLEATSAEDLLMVLATIKPEYRSTALSGRGCKILAEAADLCLVDVAGHERSKGWLVKQIVENF